ncbi:MAG: T9SS type A sorting domain-containing protein [Bacteroidia bacterium]|nr:T9SS type A sorting domain-containing protein [Bacteroidia bacterium]
MRKVYQYLALITVAMLIGVGSVNAQCPYPIPTVNVANGVICNGQPAVLSVPDVYDSYQWYWGGNIPIPVASTDYSYWAVVEGWYTLEVTLNGCASMTAPVFVSAPLVTPLNMPDTLYSCTGSLTIQMDTQLYDRFLWSNGANTSSITVTQDGWVGVGVGIDALSCGVADTFWVSLNMPGPSVSISTIGNNPFCTGTFVILESDNATSNTWSTGSTNQSIVVNTPGTYTVTVENYYGCTATDQVVVTEIPCSPTTSLLPEYCPNLELVQTSALICLNVPGATQYEWEFIQNNSVFATKFTPYNYLVLHSISPQITFGNEYDVQVRAYVGGQWGPFGTLCHIGLVPQPTPSTVPLTQLRAEDCGKLDFRLNSNNRIVAIPVYQAIGYEFEFSDLGGNVLATKTTVSPVVFLNTVNPALSVPGQYNVRVRALYGGVWGMFGQSCLIGIVSNNKEEASDNQIESIENNKIFEVGTYPNPFGNNAVLSILSSDRQSVEVDVYDITGKLVDSFTANANDNTTFGENYQKGIYLIKVVSPSGETKNIKIVKN